MLSTECFGRLGVSASVLRKRLDRSCLSERRYSLILPTKDYLSTFRYILRVPFFNGICQLMAVKIMNLLSVWTGGSNIFTRLSLIRRRCPFRQ